MDPLSIAASVGSLSGVCIVTLKKLSEVAGKFKEAPKIIKDISSEARIITISLSELRNALLCDDHSIVPQSLQRPDIRNDLDIALTGCNMTLSCLETEISRLTTKIYANQNLSFADRAKVVWKDDKFKELLQQLSRQHNAIAILSQGLQMKALGDLVTLLAKNRAVIQNVADGTESLRGLYPQANAAKSFLESFECPSEDEVTVSTISEREFGFDDEAINSPAYRRVVRHTLRNTRSGNVLGSRHFDETGLGEGTLRHKRSSPGIQGANQARKISAAPQFKTVATSDNNLLATLNDPNIFVQQFRGYLDNVEGELRKATNEIVQLREEVQEKGNQIQALESHVQVSDERAGKVESQMKLAVEEREALGIELNRLVEAYDQTLAQFCSAREARQTWETKARQMESDLTASRTETETAKKELQEHEKSRVQLESNLIAFVAETEKFKQELREHEQSRVEMGLKLTLSRTETENLQKELQGLEQSRAELEAKYSNDISILYSQLEERRNKLQHANDELSFYISKLEDLKNREKRRKKVQVESLQSGLTLQIGSTLLVPLQSQAWLDKYINRPRLFQAVSIPETPTGWIPIWDYQYNRPIFMNEYTGCSQVERPTLPAAKSPSLTATPQHVPTRVPPTVKSISRHSNKKATKAIKSTYYESMTSGLRWALDPRITLWFSEILVFLLASEILRRGFEELPDPTPTTVLVLRPTTTIGHGHVYPAGTGWYLAQPLIVRLATIQSILLWIWDAVPGCFGAVFKVYIDLVHQFGKLKALLLNVESFSDFPSFRGGGI